ncbi:MAG: hypothetical protein GQE15_34235 [Archangiaceae bacterium]|nr:hypothetical protein [Archangiaceae bacterium]
MDPIEAGPPRVVVIEPLFERAEWKTSTRTEFVDAAAMGSSMVASPLGQSSSPLGASGASQPVVVTQTTTEKPLFGRPSVLAAIHERLLPAVAALRPHWTIVAPGAAPTITRNAVVIRTVLDGNEVVESDRPLKNAAFAFGLVILPLQIFTAFPVEETQRISGQLEKVALEPKALQQRLVKYATQPDFAVNLSGLKSKRQPFALDVQYEEGLFADESPRPAVLVEGFVERLAYAIVTLVEEESL